MLNGHKQICPACDASLYEMKISYLEFVNLTRDERAVLLESCKDEETLQNISTTYKMFKYSKWYQAQHSTEPLYSKPCC